jgi:hypothetical protein
MSRYSLTEGGFSAPQYDGFSTHYFAITTFEKKKFGVPGKGPLTLFSPRNDPTNAGNQNK